MSKASTKNNNITFIANGLASSMGSISGKSRRSNLHCGSRFGSLYCLTSSFFVISVISFAIPAPHSLSLFATSLFSYPLGYESKVPVVHNKSYEERLSQPATEAVSIPARNSSSHNVVELAHRTSQQSNVLQQGAQTRTTNNIDLETHFDEYPPPSNQIEVKSQKQIQTAENKIAERNGEEVYSSGERMSISDSDGSRVGEMKNFVPTTVMSLPNGMRQCGHMLLISAARHGSTWLLDCVENCTFSSLNDGTFGKLNAHTEIWNQAQDGPVATISVDSAINYVQRNMSLKIFPYPFQSHTENATRLIEQSFRNSIPLVVLTRNFSAAYRSFQVARQSSVWNTNSAAKRKDIQGDNDMDISTRLTVRRDGHAVESIDDGNGEKNSETDVLLKGYEESLRLYFDNMYKILDDRSFPYDVLDYEVVKKQKWIVLPRHQCYIYNCNFNL